MSQRVEVAIYGADKTFAYEWHGDTPLSVGDRVLLPANWRNNEPFPGTVWSLEPGSYQGPLVAILEKL